MRIVVLFFVIAACAPTVQTTTAPKSDPTEFARVLKTNEDLASNYSQNTEAMFALLWPSQFTPTTKILLSKSLKIARALQKTRSDYTVEASRLRKSTQKHNCDCVLTGICEIEIDPLQQDELLQHCTKIEAEQLQNDEQLSRLVSLQDELKNQVLTMGGYWLTVITPPVYQFTNGNIDFQDAEFFNGEGEKLGLKNKQVFWQLDTVKTDGALQAQGELKIVSGTQLYRGELGFQLLERGN